MMSASSARGVICAPPCDSSPIMTSLSTRFLGQPRLTKPTFLGVGRGASSGGSSRATESCLTGMESLYFSIYGRVEPMSRRRAPAAADDSR